MGLLKKVKEIETKNIAADNSSLFKKALKYKDNINILSRLGESAAEIEEEKKNYIRII
ncbi:hypothetical protein WKV44_05870 [Spirochaetia bacterium 38H-sp]|uniref:Uncharacterized protein n=1 Tax=Rarispira pelagica TaxID=3141764 RepID=A0ABU9UBM0_9SPIR